MEAGSGCDEPLGALTVESLLLGPKQVPVR